MLGVLVPFGALVVLGLVFVRQETPGPEPLPAAPKPAVPVAPTAPPRAVAPLPLEADAGETDEPVPKELAAPLAAITPEVMRCFSDERAHLKTPQRFEVRFTPTPDGGFADVHVPGLSNPLIGACVEDVLEEVRFAPTGAETFRPAIHTFVFDPSRD